MTTTILHTTTLDEAARTYAAQVARRLTASALDSQVTKALNSMIAADLRRAGRGTASDRVAFACYMTEDTDQADRYFRRVRRYIRAALNA